MKTANKAGNFKRLKKQHFRQKKDGYFKDAKILLMAIYGRQNMHKIHTKFIFTLIKPVKGTVHTKIKYQPSFIQNPYMTFLWSTKDEMSDFVCIK